MSVIEVLSPLKTLPRNWAGINLDFQKRMANIFWNMNKKKIFTTVRNVYLLF